jgi:hypothetical protein
MSARSLLLGFRAVLDDRKDLVLAHDQILLAVELDLLPRVLAEQDRVAGLDVERQALAFVGRLAVAGRDDAALLRLLLGGVGDDDPADPLLFFFPALDDDAVAEVSRSWGITHNRCMEAAGRSNRRRTHALPAGGGAAPSGSEAAVALSTHQARLLIIVWARPKSSRAGVSQPCASGGARRASG